MSDLTWQFPRCTFCWIHKWFDSTDHSSLKWCKTGSNSVNLFAFDYFDSCNFETVLQFRCDFVVFRPIQIWIEFDQYEYGGNLQLYTNGFCKPKDVSPKGLDARWGFWGRAE